MGNGKTTFLKMWAQHLRNQNHAVVEFNAWETEFCKNPFIALFSELEIALTQNDNSVGKYSQIRAVGKDIFEEIISAASKINAISVGYAGLNVGIGIGSNSDSVTDENIIEYKDVIKLLKNFKSLLEQTASKLYELEYKSLVIVIDELDRCRPSYALELLENARHIFGVKDIVFILGINRAQLEYSIEALYGSKFDAQEYTRRYFDLDYKLPSPSRNDFIDNIISKTNIQNYFNSNNEISVIGDFNIVKQMLDIFFIESNISLRTIEQTMQRLGVVCTLLKKDTYTYITVAVVVLILKTIDSDIFNDFVVGNISDLELVDKLVSKKRINQSNEYAINCFEAVIIVIAMHINLSIQKEPDKSPLYKHYKKLSLNVNNPENLSYPGTIIGMADIINNIHCVRKGITSTLERIEFVSEELLSFEE